MTSRWRLLGEIGSPVADESGLSRGPGFRGGPADQLDQAEDEQQQDDENDDDQSGGMAPEDKYQGEKRHRSDTQSPAVRVRPLADRAGRHATALTEVTDPAQPRLQGRTGLDRRARRSGDEGADGDDQPDRQDDTESDPDEVHHGVERRRRGVAGQHGGRHAVEVDGTGDEQANG